LLLIMLPALGALAAEDELATADFDYARILAEKGFYDLAMVAYKDAIKEHKDHERVEEALVSIADLKAAMGRLDEALADYQKFLKDYAYSKQAMRARFGIGEVLYEKGDYEGALKQFRFIAENDEDTASDAYIRASYNVCWCLMKLGRYEEAARGFQEFAVVYAGLDMATESWLALGECYLKMGKGDKALYAFTKARALSKDKNMLLRATYGLGRACYEAKKFDDARRAFDDMVKRAGGGAYAALADWWKALCYEGEGNYNKAIEAFNEIMKKYPGTEYAQRALDKLAELSRGSSGWLLSESQRYAVAQKEYEKGNYEAAKARYEQLVKAFPKGEFAARAYRGIAHCLVKLGKLKEAADTLMKAAELYPQDAIAPECVIEAASLYGKANDNEGRERALARLAADFPEYGKGDRIKFTLASLKFNEGDYARAAQMFEEVVRSFPKSDLRGSAMFRAAYCTFLAGEKEKALAMFDKFLKEFPDSEDVAQAYYFKGEALTELNRAQEAVEAYRLCIGASTKPELTAAAHYRLGLLKEKSGDMEEALAEYNAAVSANPKGTLAPTAKLRAAMIYYQMKQPDRCRVALLELLRDYPDYAIPAVTLDWLAEELMKMGDVEGAIRISQLVIQRYENEDAALKLVQQAHFRMGRALLKQGKWREAYEAYEKGLLSKFPESPFMPQAKLDMAQALVNMHEYDRAILLLQDLANAAKGDLSLEVQFKIAEIFEIQGKTAEAARVLERATILPGKLSSNDWLIRCYVKLGELKERLGDNAGAIAAYDHALALETKTREIIALKDKARDRRRVLAREGT